MLVNIKAALTSSFRVAVAELQPPPVHEGRFRKAFYRRFSTAFIEKQGEATGPCLFGPGTCASLR
jgi:hypothetical protein